MGALKLEDELEILRIKDEYTLIQSEKNKVSTKVFKIMSLTFYNRNHKSFYSTDDLLILLNLPESKKNDIHYRVNKGRLPNPSIKIWQSKYWLKKEIDIILREDALNKTIVEDISPVLLFLKDYSYISNLEIWKYSGHNGDDTLSMMAWAKIIKWENFGKTRAKEILRNLFLDKEKYLEINEIDSDYFEGKVFDKICDLYLKYKDIL